MITRSLEALSYLFGPSESVALPCKSPVLKGGLLSANDRAEV
jgi:hypothetical protein